MGILFVGTILEGCEKSEKLRLIGKTETILASNDFSLVNLETYKYANSVTIAIRKEISFCKGYKWLTD